MTRFSLALGVGRREPMERIAELARFVEDAGFHGLWIQDNPLMAKDPYMALTVVALNTTRLALAPGVSNPVVRHPSIIVNAIATLDQLSGGRARLGVGMGGAAQLTPLGIKTSLSQFRESLVQMKALLQGGEVLAANAGRFRVGTVQRAIPVYVAAQGPRMLRLTGELADGVLIGGIAQRDDYLRKLQCVREGAQAAGRHSDEVKVNLLVTLCLDDDPEQALATARPYAASLALESFGQRDAVVPPQFQAAVAEIRRLHDPSRHLSIGAPQAEAVTPELARYLVIAGDEPECQERLDSLLSLDPDEVTFTLQASGRVGRLKTLARLVRRYSINN